MADDVRGFGCGLDGCLIAAVTIFAILLVMMFILLWARVATG